MENDTRDARNEEIRDGEKVVKSSKRLWGQAGCENEKFGQVHLGRMKGNAKTRSIINLVAITSRHKCTEEAQRSDKKESAKGRFANGCIRSFMRQPSETFLISLWWHSRSLDLHLRICLFCVRRACTGELFSSATDDQHTYLLDPRGRL
jgi:hypothetical protein